MVSTEFITVNPLEEERRKYRPRLPQLLEEIGSLEMAPGVQGEVPQPIQSLLPHTSVQHIVHFIKKNAQKRAALRVGVVLSGGQAPGGHNVIIGLFDALQKLNQESSLIGFLGGPSGILENKYRELKQGELKIYLNSGGFDLIGSGRTKIEEPQQFETALKHCEQLKLNGLVIIGGDDSNTNAALLAEYFLSKGSKICVIGVPKTIDGDLKNRFIETSFGFDTACKIYAEMIGNICRDAHSAKKYTHFIKLMGRSASHIALECALQTHPNLTLISEEIASQKMTLHQLVDTICVLIAQRAEKGKNYGVILIPEGIIEAIPELQLLFGELNTVLQPDMSNIHSRLSPESSAVFSELPEEIARQLLLERDPHGNVQVSQIATEQIFIRAIQERLKNKKFNPLAHFLGYEGRSGYPTNFDANYCYALGYTAVALMMCEVTGYMSCLQHLHEQPEEWVPAGIPLTLMMDMEERKGKKKPVIKKALVDLSGEPFKYFANERSRWRVEDMYRYPGPIQFSGPSTLCDATTMTLKLEQSAMLKVE